MLLFALGSEAARALSQQFEQKSVQKNYWAVVRGHLHGAGRIDYRPERAARQNRPHALAHADKPAQSALTDRRALAHTEQPFAAAARYPTSRYSWLSSPRTPAANTNRAAT